MQESELTTLTNLGCPKLLPGTGQKLISESQNPEAIDGNHMQRVQ